MVGSSIRALYRQLISIIVVFGMLMLVACGGGVVGDDSNFIIVKDQTIIHLDEVTIESVTVDRNVIVVIYEANPLIQNAKTNTVLGYTALSAGQYNDVKIQLKRDASDNETFYAELREDNGTIGMLERNGVDTIISQSSISAISFGVMYSQAPYLEASLNEDNKYIASSRFPQRIDLKKVIATNSVWLVVHRNNNGSPGAILGYQKVDTGHHSDVSIWLQNALSDGDQLIIVMHENAEDSINDNFDVNTDQPVTFDGNNVQLFLDVLM